MKVMKILLLIMVFFLGFGTFLLDAKVVLAQGDGGGGAPASCPDLGPPPTPGPCSAPWRGDQTTVWNCANNACGKDGGAIEQGIRYNRYQTCYSVGLAGNGCPTWTITPVKQFLSGPHEEVTNPRFSTAGKYQICPASGNTWNTSAPRYQCSGQCYPPPKITPLEKVKAPANVFDDKANPKLPIHLTWEDNVEKEVRESTNPPPDTALCQVDSYHYEVQDVSGGTLATGDSSDLTLKGRSFIPSPNECILKPQNPYVFHAQACLNGRCGDPGKLAFATSAAPQLLSPYDPDWEGPEEKTTSFPATLQWCPLETAQSYRLRTYIDKGGKKTCHPWLSIGTQCDSFLIRAKDRPPPPRTEVVLRPLFEDKEGVFTKDTHYKWEAAYCDTEDGLDCSVFSQLWGLFISPFALEKVVLVSPLNDPEMKTPVGIPLILDWQDKPGTNSYIYEITPLEGGERIVESVGASQTLSLNVPQIALSSRYTWKVKACSDFDAKNCEPNFSDVWNFKTTGAPPTALTQEPSDSTGTLIPATFRWNSIPGAGSYRYEVFSDAMLNNRIAAETIEVPTSFASVDYPQIHMDKDYWWHVKTCAGKEGKTCGRWSSEIGVVGHFHTFTLKNPISPTVPKDGSQFFTYERTLSWPSVPGAKAYLYTIHYEASNPPQEETDPRCPSRKNTDIYSNKSTPFPQISPKFTCLGNYTWQVTSCLDAECAEKSTITPPSWAFTHVQPEPSAFSGLLSCGTASNSPDTSYNERDPCEFKHIFLLIRNLIDFALWKLSLVIVVVMAIVTGAIMFFSFGGVDVMTKVRSIWRSVGIGVLILLFSWLFLNILLDLVGFNIKFYGKWYDIPFSP